MTDIVERLREKILADAFEAGQILSGSLTERLIVERWEAAAEIKKLRGDVSYLKDEVIPALKAEAERVHGRITPRVEQDAHSNTAGWFTVGQSTIKEG